MDSLSLLLFFLKSYSKANTNDTELLLGLFRKLEQPLFIFYERYMNDCFINYCICSIMREYITLLSDKIVYTFNIGT